MPNTLRELFARIDQECDGEDVSGALVMYAIGWVFFDIFERAEHDEKAGKQVGPADLDRYAAEIPDGKIGRDVAEAQQAFGRVAAAFMEDEIQKRIRTAIDESVVKEVRSNLAGWKPFFLNVTAGVVAGIIFAVITVGAYIFVKVDPSLNAMAKAEIEQSTPAPAVKSPASSGAAPTAH